MIRLPLLFIATGIISFIAYHLLTLFSLGTWVLEPPRNPDGWFRIHLLVLDWATMIAMGAVYQLIDVVLQRRIHSRLLGYIHYACFTVGSIILLAGFLRMETLWIAVGGTLAFAGIGLFAWNVGRTLLAAKMWNAVTLSTALSIGYLVITGLLGMAMGLNFAFNLWSAMHEQMLAAHIWVGTLGWFGLLITGFSYKMLPMFYLSHGAAEKPQRTILLLWNGGVLLGALSFMLGYGTWGTGVSVALLLAALVIYEGHMRDIRKHRHKATPGNGIVWSVWCTRALLVFVICLLGRWAWEPETVWNATFVLLSGWVYLWGWVAMTILGYLSKIVPFLWWTHKYGPHAGKPGVPVMSDLIYERHVGWGMAGMAAALVVTLAGTGLNIPGMMALGVSVMSLCSLFYMSLVARVFTK
jgi:hypothetical protein